MTPPAQATAAVTEGQRVMNYLMLERQLQDNVMEMAERLGLLCYHTFDSRRSEKGFPDIVAIGKRKVLFIELKRQGGKLRPEQQTWRERLEATARYSQHEYHLWRPSDWTSGIVEEVLRAA